MNEEQIIRKEAESFYERNLESSLRINVVEDFHKLKNRLEDFYTPENKAIFLDEIELQLEKDLLDHRNQAHDGKASPTCQKEIKAEKLLFYIKQEISVLPKIAHQKYKSTQEVERKKVFVSYSHFDKEYLNDIQRHFKPFLGQIDFWDDTRILPGQKWKEEIKKALNETKVAILLVSTDFLGSEFISTDELPPLLEAAEEKGAVILNLILKPCLFEDFPNLNQFQAMNPPNRPVIKMDYVEKEELFVNLVRQTKRILQS